MKNLSTAVAVSTILLTAHFLFPMVAFARSTYAPGTTILKGQVCNPHTMTDCFPDVIEFVATNSNGKAKKIYGNKSVIFENVGRFVDGTSLSDDDKTAIRQQMLQMINSIDQSSTSARKSRAKWTVACETTVTSGSNGTTTTGTCSIKVTFGRGNSSSTTSNPLVDGVTCQGNSPSNYVCSSEKIVYGCTEETKTCFYEEK